MVDRLRVLHLFSLFYDSSPADTRDKLYNPRKCKSAPSVYRMLSSSIRYALILFTEYFEVVSGMYGIDLIHITCRAYC